MLSQKPTEGEVRKIQGALVRHNRQLIGYESDDDTQALISEERIAQLRRMADRDDIDESDLTEGELQMFREAVRKGEVKFESWNPWWQYNVVELDNEIPPPHICCPNTGHNYDSRVWSTIIEAVYAMCHILRRYNGSDEDIGMQQCAEMMSLAKGLISSDIPQSPYLTCAGLLERATEAPVRCTDTEFNILCMHDVINVMEFREHTTRALKSLAEWLRRSSANNKRILLSQRKLLFLISVAYHHWSNQIAEEVRRICVNLENRKIVHDQHNIT
eukprot:GHVO01037116.1.p1 GENE.GHVO01037116.1~~GHVO01037116.1.p1  ORF type:complete len:273 (-),score=55.97 GHVO01037116.1:268-1086(-)